jgi:hypothetical protein
LQLHGRGQALQSKYVHLNCWAETPIPENYRVGGLAAGSKYQDLPTMSFEEAIERQNRRFGHVTPSGRRNVSNAIGPRLK